MNTSLKIDFVSDIACPWCAVGLGALEQALASVKVEISADLHFQPFELNPQMAREGEDIDEHLVKKYGGTPKDFEGVRKTLRERGAAVGFHFGERKRIYNTFNAHRLLHWAGLQGGDAQHRLKAALLQAYHGEARDPSEAAVLVDVVRGAGLDAERAAAILAGDEYTAEVRAAEEHWTRLGIHAVPSVIINGRHLIQGGQPPEVFVQALRQIAAEAASQA